MRPVFNLGLLKHTSVSGNSMNNLLTLFHAMEAEGTYHGSILQGEKLFAEFTILCSKDAKEKQLHIDLSLFDQLHAQSLKQLHYRNPLFHIQPGGVLLFFISGRHHDFSILIGDLKNKKVPEFNSNHLTRKDKAAFRLFHFGNYELTDTLKKKKMLVEVVKKSREESSKTAAVPVRVRHSEKGFEKETIKVYAGQLLLIDSTGEIAVQLTKRDKKESEEKEKRAS